MIRIFEEAARLERDNIPFALVSITKSEGSTPRSQAHMIVLTDGTSIGTIGGGVAEFQAIERAVELIPQRKSDRLAISLTIADGHNCGGMMELFIDVVSPERKLVLFGGGHVNFEIAQLAVKCGFRIEVVETRPEYANRERFPWASRIHIGTSIEEVLKAVTIDADTVIVIATHSLDRQVLEHVVNSNAAYIGMLASRTKVNEFRRYLKAEKHLDINTLKHFHSPVGLDIGSETPEEIAVGVIAEILMVLNRRDGKPLRQKAENLIVVRGAGDLATGVICRLHKAGYRVVALEIPQPTTIRRTVAFSEAMYGQRMVVDGVECLLAKTTREAKSYLDRRKVALLCDPEGDTIDSLKPAVVIDAIIAKKNCGTHKDMAPLVIALGPGFVASQDCHIVIETQRGHDLGKIITNGSAVPNSGIPGDIDGFSTQRVVRAPAQGVFAALKHIGDSVKKEQTIASIGNQLIKAPIDGVIRGMLHDGLHIRKECKVADIDPRNDVGYCQSMSDKARAIGGAVLEVVDGFHARRLHID